MQVTKAPIAVNYNTGKTLNTVYHNGGRPRFVTFGIEIKTTVAGNVSGVALAMVGDNPPLTNVSEGVYKFPSGEVNGLVSSTICFMVKPYDYYAIMIDQQVNCQVLAGSLWQEADF